MDIFDNIICTKILKKYDKSKYKKEIIKKIHISVDGGIILETDTYMEKFYTNDTQDIIDNAEVYDADFIICMLQHENNINVSKY